MTKESENKDSREQGGAMVPLLTAARMLAEGNHEGALERARSVTGGAYHAKALMLEAQVLALKGAPDEQTEAVLKKAADAGDKTAAFYKAYTDAGSTDTEVVQAAEGFQNWAVVRHVALFRSAESLQPPTPEERAEQRRAVEEHIARLEASEAEAEKARREAEAKAAAERARREAEAKAAAERARREAEAEKARKEAEAKAAAEAARKKAKAEADAKAAAEKARKEAARKASSRKGVPVLLALLVAGVEAVLFCRIWGVEASSWFNRSLAILLFALSLLVFPVAHALMEGATNREKAVSASADGQLALAVNCVAMLLAHLQTFHIIFAGEPLNTLCILGCFGLLYLALIVVCFTLCLADGADDNGSHGRCVGALFWTPIAACLLYFGILRLFGTPWDAFVQVISQLTA